MKKLIKIYLPLLLILCGCSATHSTTVACYLLLSEARLVMIEGHRYIIYNTTIIHSESCTNQQHF